MKKIISLSLWGDDPKYVIGAIRNAELAPKIYPGWTCRFYIGEHKYSPEYQYLNELARHSFIEIVQMPTGFEGWKGMFARFLPASEEDVDVFISRDCDSRISTREAAAVKEWLDNPQLVHSIADHPYHFHPKHGLMGGMFGMKKYGCPEMALLIDQFKSKYSNSWQCDQDFLREYILPKVVYKLYATSDIHPGCHPFPMPRVSEAFVGEIIGPNEEIIYPEHRSIRGSCK